uniref:Uncharacterized protein n=1 Tax=Candidatus Kentrum sp. FW TaxID=2126338 RepID=A0A450SR83_9GAMM|nr:MAG: hypothetical protein BECKFW1821B_GA0114236_102835 [Candidatus Kentron sp. FW]
MKFEWNNRKAAGNLKTHRVSFHEAASVFGDPLAITFDDPDHSIDERRLLTFAGFPRTLRGKPVTACLRCILDADVNQRKK